MLRTKFPAISLKRYLLLQKKEPAKLQINSKKNIQPVIGLEIHTQLLTKSKLFSFAPVQSDAASNSAVSDFDLGVPGTLPSLNKECVQKSLRAALLLKSEIQPMCRFDRKHYFYPDMPMGYQITQQDYPIACGGSFSYYVDGSKNNFKRQNVRLKQIQLEMDSGKTIKADENRIFIDLNRAGVGLIEIVTEPDFHSGADAATFVDQIRMLFIENSICAGELHKGNMRVDANISICVDGIQYPRTEIKNISSIRLMEKAIENEISRQTKLFNENKTVEPVTLHLDETGNVTIARVKGDDLDYRFTPEPNLPRLCIEKAWINAEEKKARTSLPFEHYILHYRMKPSDAIELVKDVEKFGFVQATLPRLDISPEMYFNLLKELQLACEKTGVRYPPDSDGFSEMYVQLLDSLNRNFITKLSFIDLLKRYLSNEIKIPVKEIIEQENLKCIHSSDPAFEKIFKEVCEKNPQVVEKIKMSIGKAQQKAINKLRNAILVEAKKRIIVEDAERAIRDYFKL